MAETKGIENLCKYFSDRQKIHDALENLDAFSRNNAS